ncbi:amino acid permease-domain-containing protein [Yarrowia lipolytica]|uniref:YALI0C07678p n=2 Tax=Yarrowia lipolytica TaxID=4952 RepID=Q6CCP6_YARLI|nr:YALI0C07678p [Yarrowia lipolytica CLIB122]RDW27181.1 amino acid permease-domain-containing protein [Yarrowia lipolytica]RDW32598.1 amino acid permease-domain-containing protein [Yarrowia lipolytica]RDW41769.1 amino acid permease-domain-containing protein [Yarrowia lipolytica]RDW48143.1 amino acid permease-domain-containing protein [Yarrowia lipolytica]RDW54934.1 amino acid permease-domain-containing protein [Yarrowia lipolytica]|eukprot:XP_501566.1 YALI0C07678p [Yarrowia lipolytica CLIB122]
MGGIWASISGKISQSADGKTQVRNRGDGEIVINRTDSNGLFQTSSLVSLPPDYEKTHAIRTSGEESEEPPRFSEQSSKPPSYHTTQRLLKARHIQLIGIGGTIGTVLFVQIGAALVKGGPASLFLGFTLWCIPILMITMTTAEMVTYLPISSPFIRFAGRYVDESFEVMAGWNFFLLQAVQVPFEITAVNIILHFWVDGYSVAIPLVVQCVLYAIINVFAVGLYGETEFWLSLGKLLLAVGVILFTFITMCGGNPQHDAYGFRYWNNPGAFAEYMDTGSWGRFLGFFACLVQAAFSIAGPEYVSMAAGEAVNPRVVMPKAYKAVLYRLSFFFILGALAVGIIVPYNDPELLDAINSGKPGAAASPYVIGMQRLNIKVLPHIMNGLVLTSAFSAGNSFTYCASRTLYGLALEGYAPRIFAKCTKQGVPIFAVIVVLCFGLLSFLQLGNTAQVVLNWLVNIVTASQLINFCILCSTYLRFFYGLRAQGISRDSLPFKSFWQPGCAWVGLTCAGVMLLLSGWTVFVNGHWSTATFLFSYIMIPIDVVIFIAWKLIKRTKFKKLTEIDFLTGKKEIDEYTEDYTEVPPTNIFQKIGRWLF